MGATTSKTVIKATLSQEELARAIVDAINRQKLEEAQQKREAKDQWKRHIGFRDNPCWLRNVCNGVWCMLKLLTCPKKYKAGSVSLGTTVLLMTSISLVFSVLEYALYLFSVSAIYLAFTGAHPLTIITSVAFLLFARLFRIARLEVEEMSDTGMLLSIFTAIVSFVGLIVSFKLK